MNVIVLVVVTGVILLIYDLVKRCERATDSEALQEEEQQRLEDESSRFEDEPRLLSAGENPWLIQEPETEMKPIENVTSILKNAADQSRCPACGAIITAKDERCPSCEISFVTDGIAHVTDSFQKWTPRSVGPTDGICVPPTGFRE